MTGVLKQKALVKCWTALPGEPLRVRYFGD